MKEDWRGRGEGEERRVEKGMKEDWRGRGEGEERRV